jgi:NitT/TauT family transport system substrate-binding protein
MKMIGRILLAAAFALGLSGTARALETVTTGMVGSPGSGSWPYHIGIAKGFFADAGITLDLIYAPTAPGLMQQLASGSVDIVGTNGVVEPIHAIEKGASVALFRILGAVPPYEMLAKPEIASIKDLKGKIICIGGLVDINRVYLDRIMNANGLHNGDYDIVVVGNTAGRFAALKSGTIDATMLVPPVNFYAEEAGFRNIGMILDYAKDLPFTGAAVQRGWVAKHRDAAEHFRVALDRSIDWFYDDKNREEAIDILTKEMKSGRDAVAKSYDYLRKIEYFSRTDAVSRKRLESLIKAMKDLGDIAGTVTVDKLVISGLTPITD